MMCRPQYFHCIQQYRCIERSTRRHFSGMRKRSYRSKSQIWRAQRKDDEYAMRTAQTDFFYRNNAIHAHMRIFSAGILEKQSQLNRMTKLTTQRSDDDKLIRFRIVSRQKSLVIPRRIQYLLNGISRKLSKSLHLYIPKSTTRIRAQSHLHSCTRHKNKIPEKQNAPVDAKPIKR